MSEPIFRSCIVSRPVLATELSRRFPAFAVATTIYLVGGAGLALAPLFMLEMESPANATVAPPGDTPIIFRPPGGGREAGGRGAPLIRKGGAPQRRPDAAPNDPDRSARPRPAVIRQPAVVPLETPESETPLGTHDPGHRASGGPTLAGRGEPDGEGSSPDGSAQGCPGCSGDGPGGSGDFLGGPPGQYDESDPRITTQPALIPGTRALPVYPDLARRAGMQGSVILLVVIGVDGRVGAIEVLRSPDPRFAFDLAAIEAVKQWRYSPALMGGRPVAVQARVIVEFTLAR